MDADDTELHAVKVGSKLRTLVIGCVGTSLLVGMTSKNPADQARARRSTPVLFRFRPTPAASHEFSLDEDKFLYASFEDVDLTALARSTEFLARYSARGVIRAGPGLANSPALKCGILWWRLVAIVSHARAPSCRAGGKRARRSGPFCRKNERELFHGISGSWEPDYRLYPHVPFSSLVEIPPHELSATELAFLPACWVTGKCPSGHTS